MTSPSLCRLLLWVHDCSALADWYKATFGWTIAVDERAEQWIELDAGGFTLALHGGSKGPSKRVWPKMQIRVDDVAAYRARLIGRGIAMGEIQQWKHLAWSEGKDPEGNIFQIANR